MDYALHSDEGSDKAHVEDAHASVNLHNTCNRVTETVYRQPSGAIITLRLEHTSGDLD
ncbi:hypothetical protein J5I95_23070 [Candidatus Poribacteria bacterium]|nr:hypothetical protein [Candidatus Poribacteria bacterium]